jgi:hypothetical protein
VVNQNLEGINTDKFLNAIHKAETNNSNDLTIKNSESSAKGLYQILEGTRTGIYNNFFKNSMTKEEFNINYNNDPQFQRTVASKYLEMNQPLVQSLQQKYNIPQEYSQSILYFLGAGDGPKYIEDYVTTGSHKIAQQKLDDRIRARNKGNLPNNQTVEKYVRTIMNSYYSQ